MDNVSVTIIGAGVVGLAIAKELSAKYSDIVVLERHESFGKETSSRNSEVIHSGIYYPEGSLKARLCVEGARQLYELCQANLIPFKKTGKLIVAAEQSEVKGLEGLYEKGRRNSVEGLSLLDSGDVRRLEPDVRAVSALHSPDTGIIDSHSLMKSLYTMAVAKGVMFSFQSEVAALEREKDGFVVRIRQEDYSFGSKIVINSAGLSSDSVAGLAGMDIEARGYKLKYCKGSYFSYAKASPVSMLVYPVPHEELIGLGVHATLDLGGRLRFGPDAEYVDHVDYAVDPGKRDSFYEGAVRIIPGLDREAFIPDMAGIRPKLYGEGDKVRDFVISDEADKGLPGLINLVGIESPGLTASPAIAKMVAGMVQKYL
ncbi:MAG: NAD(P)/FAD-dependent oxidoreductase [Nitrospirae bacterium]|nr:NAD(P)/FAD-dependent oxidoreductase [Nitrospirota bacterium]